MSLVPRCQESRLNFADKGDGFSSCQNSVALSLKDGLLNSELFKDQALLTCSEVWVGELDLKVVDRITIRYLQRDLRRIWITTMALIVPADAWKVLNAA
jgi:hypothetical protein